MFARLVFLLYVCALCVLARPAAAQQVVPDPVITNVRGDLYQVSHGSQVSLFLVTPEGIVLADSLSSDVMRWLAKTLPERFPDRPVRYLLLTSHEFERARGASFFGRSVTVLAHEGYKPARAYAGRSLPPSWRAFDRNGDSVLQRDEATAAGADALGRDGDKDGRVTPEEAWEEVPQPTRTYNGSRFVLTLGGRQVVLYHVSDAFGADRSLVLFAGERVLFAPGLPTGEAPEDLGQGSPTDVVRGFTQVEALDFDQMLDGRGQPRTKREVSRPREYVETLIQDVEAGFMRGESVQQMQVRLDLTAFTDLRHAGTRRNANIEQVYRRLHLLTVDVMGTGQLTYVVRQSPGCPTLPMISRSCPGPGGASYGGALGASVMYGRLGGAVEFTLPGARTGEYPVGSGFPPFSYSYKQQVLSYMFRYALGRADRSGVALLAGRSRIVETFERTSNPGELFGPGSPFDATITANVFGADIVARGGRLRFAVPVRVTRLPSSAVALGVRDEPSWEVRVGIGVSVPFSRASF